MKFLISLITTTVMIEIYSHLALLLVKLLDYVHFKDETKYKLLSHTIYLQSIKTVPHFSKALVDLLLGNLVSFKEINS